MRTTPRLLGLALMSALLGTGVMACERQGPMERTGEEVDEAADTMKNGGESLESKADDSMDRAADQAEAAGEAIEKKTDEAAAATEQAGEEK